MRASKASPPKKKQATFNLPEDLLDDMRDAALHFSGPPHFMSLASIAEEAIRRELDRVKRELNRGKRIPRYEDRTLRPGRRPTQRK
jgi:uncharacterized protein YdeI (YjbR/CyaY-like superfamily)